MAANNDYFVKFASNAPTFSRDLQADLQGARNVIKLLRNDLQYLNRDIAATARLRAKLAGNAGQAPPPGGSAPPPGINTKQIQNDLSLASEEALNLIKTTEKVVKAMRLTAEEIAEVPGKISAAVASALRSVENQRRIAEGQSHRDPATGRFDTPGPGTVPVTPRQVVAAYARPITPPKPSIANVSPAAIDRAGVDRIVKAIRDLPDRMVKKGVATRQVGEYEVPVTAATVTKGGKAKQAVQQGAQSVAELTAIVQTLLAQVGDVADESAQAAIQQAKAALAAAQRAEQGITPKQQKAQRRAEAETKRQARKSISDDDLRQVLSPGAENFTERLGRKKDDYTLAQLHQMADAYERIGIAVQRTQHTKKEDLARNLQGAFGEFSSLYPGGAKDFKVGKTTKIPEHTRALLGEIDQDLIDARQAAIALRRANTAGGGKNTQVDGGGKYGTKYGAGVFPWDEVGSPVVRQGTPEQLRATYALLNADPSRQMSRVRGMAQFDPSFNPFDESHKIREGNTPEAKALADAARARLRDMRLATIEIDKMGDEYRTLTDAIDENAEFIKRAQRRIRKGTAFDDDPERLDQAQREIAPRLQQRMADLLKAAPFLTSDTYQQGYEARREPRAQYLDAVRQLQEGANRNNVSLYSDIRQALVEGIIRVGQPSGRLPNLTYRGNDLVASEGMSRQDFADLKRAVSHLAHTQEKTFDLRAENALRREAGLDEIDTTKAERRLENAAAKLANRIEKITGGLAPSIFSLTGREPEIEGNITADERRRTAMEQARRDSVNPTESDEQKAARLRNEVLRAQTRLGEAKDREADLAERARREAAASLEAYERLEPDQKRQVDRQRQIAINADRIAKALARQLDDLENIKYRNYPPTAGDVDPEDPLLRGQARERDAEFEAMRQQLTDRLLAAQAKAQRANRAAQQVGQETYREGPSDQERARATALQAEARALNETIKAERRRAADLRGQIAALPAATRTQGGRRVTLDREGNDVRESGQRSVTSIKRELSKALAEVEAAVSLNHRTIRENALRIKGLLRESVRTVGDAPAGGLPTRAQREAAQAAAEVERLSADLADLEKRSRAAGNAVEREATAEASKASAVEQAVRASNAGGGAGGTAPPTAQGGDEGDENLLRLILAELKLIYAALKGGVRTTPATGGTTGAAARALPSVTTTAAPGESDAEVLARTRAARSRARAARSTRAEQIAAEEELRVAEALVDADVKEAAAMRARARQAEDLAQAMRHVSQSTEDEIAELRRLTAAARAAAGTERELAAQTAVSNQQTRVAAAVSRDLYDRHINATGRRTAVRAVLTNAGPALGSGELESILRSANSMGEQMGYAAQDGFSRIFGGGNTFWGRILHTTGTFVVRNFAAGFVFGLTNYFQQILTEALEAETTFIRVRAALEAAGVEIGNVRADLQDVSQDYGVALNDVYTAAAGLTGLFKTAPELTAGTRIVAQLQAISGGALNASEATGILAANLSAFQAQAGETFDPSRFLPEDSLEATQRVADVLTSIQTSLGVNIETAAEGAGSLAGLARQIKLSFEETAVYAAQIAKQTNQTGAAAGEQFGRIVGAIQTGRGRSALLEAFNPATAADDTQRAVAAQVRTGLEEGDLGQVIQNLIRGWDGLSESQQRNLLVSIAGQRQARAFTALVGDSAKTLDTLRRAQDSSGAATERMDKLMKTFQNRLRQLRSEFQVLAQNLVELGIFDFLGLLVVGTTQLLKAVNGLLAVFNRVTEASPFLDFMKSALASVLGLVAALKLAGVAWRGTRNALRANVDTTPSGPPSAVPQRYFGRGPDGGPRPAAPGGRYQSTLFGYPAFKASQASQSLTTQAEERAARAAALRAAGYTREAAVLDRVNRYANGATRALDGTARNLSRVAASGIGLDLAMVGLGIALTGIFQTIAENKRARASGNEGFERLTKNFRPPAQEMMEGLAEMIGVAPALFKDAVDQMQAERDRFFGQTNDEFTRKFEEQKNAGNLERGWTGLTAILSQPSSWANALLPGTGTPFGGITPTEAYRRRVGIDASTGRPAGEIPVDQMIADIPGQIANADSSGDLVKLQDRWNQELVELAYKAHNNKNLSDQQYQAWIAALERLKVDREDALGNAIAAAEGAASVGLNAQDVSAISNLISTRQTLGSSVQAGGGIDFTGVLGALQEGTGAGDDPGTKLKAWIDKALDPTSTTVQVLSANRKILAESVRQLNADLEVALRSDPQMQEDVTQQLYQQWQTTVQQFAQSSQELIDGIYAQADVVSQAFMGKDRPGQAMAAYSSAAMQAERVFAQETSDIRKRFRLIRAAWRNINNQARRVAQMLGEPVPDGPAPRFRDTDRGRKLFTGDAIRRAQFRQQQANEFDKRLTDYIWTRTAALRLQLSKTVDSAKRASLQAAIDSITSGILTGANAGTLTIPGVNPKISKKYGPLAVTREEVLDAEIAANESALQTAQAQEDAGQTAAQRAAALRQAQLGVAQAWADARGDAVKSAQIQVAIAKATIAAARADLAAAKTADETNSARIAILNAQAQLIAAHAAVQAAQSDLVQSQYDVTIALAEAAGHTVEAARRTLAAARAGLAAALRKSGGAATAEVNQARVQAIQAEAALRDARLQDDLDTIDFNLQMGKMTQASAIQALQEILRTRELTRDQRRQLLLQIKGMKEELSDSQWNFGDIRLPTPYQMRRYIQARRDQFRGELEQAATGTYSYGGTRPGGDVIDRPHQTNQYTTTNIFQIDGADIGKIRQVIREVVGGSNAINTRTTQARRGGVY